MRCWCCADRRALPAPTTALPLSVAMVSVAITVFSSVLSGFIAIGSTVAIERLGGTVGGVLATTPTTIIPFSFGLALAGLTYDEISDAMFSAPIALCLTSFYILLWREVPRLSLVNSLDSAWKQLALVLPLLLTFWIAGAIVIIGLIPVLKDAGLPIIAVGLGGLCVSLTVGVAVTFIRHVPAPTGKRSVSLLQYASRGLVAGVAIGLSLVISSISPVAGGVASVFPSITTTTMVMLWLQQGWQVPAGAAAPMMLGNLAVSSFCILFALLYPAMDVQGVPLPLTLTAVCLLCYLLATTFVSLPVFALLQWMKPTVAQERRAQARGTEEDEGEEREQEADRAEMGMGAVSAAPGGAAAAGDGVQAGFDPQQRSSADESQWSAAASYARIKEVEELKQPLTEG